jgi:hypothetical protein
MIFVSDTLGGILTFKGRFWEVEDLAAGCAGRE